MRFHVQQEGYGDVSPQRLSFHNRQHQERQPGQQRDHEDALLQQLQRIPGQMGPTQKLEERSAKDQREVFRFSEHIIFGY